MISYYDRGAREVNITLTPEEYKAIHMFLKTTTQFGTGFVQEAGYNYIKHKDAREILSRMDEINYELNNN